MDVLADYGSDNDSGLSSKLTPIKNKDQPSTGISESEAHENKLAAEWESFQALLGDAAFSKEEENSTQATAEISLPDVVPPSDSPVSAKKRSKSSSSETSDSSSSSESSSESEKERKRRRRKKASKKKASRSKSKKKKKHRKRESSSSDSSSSEESDSEKDDDEEEEEEEKKTRKTTPSCESIPRETTTSRLSSDKEITKQERSPRRVSLSENKEKSPTIQSKPELSTKKSRSRSKSKERQRSRSKSRSKDRRRRSRSRSKDRKRRSRSRGKRRRSRSRDRKRRSRSRDRHRRRRSRSKGRKRRRSRDRRRSRSRSHGKKRRSRSRSRSRDRRRHSPKRGPHRRQRAPNRPKQVIPNLTTSKSNQPLTFKEQLKQNLIAVQKQAAEGGLSLDPAAEEKLRQIAQKAQDKNNQALMNETQLNNIARTQAGHVTPQLALMQTMAAMQQKAQELTGVAVPKYYNPAAVNPLKYAEQVKKRKMLWAKKPEEQKEKEPESQVMLKSSSFGEDKTTAKFRKLMGIKGAESEENFMSDEQRKKQEEIFCRLDKEYEFARMSTHTHRGVGLGTLSHAYPPGVQAPLNPVQQEPPK